LVSTAERARIRGFLINKFRGDYTLLEPGIRLLEQRTGIPVLGVLPYIPSAGIPQEDSAILERACVRRSSGDVNIAVVHLPRIANYTDFAPLEDEPGVTIHYLTDPLSAPDADVLILPGTKSTVADLEWFRRAGWEDFLVRHRRNGGWIVGVCGGYQMLGQRIIDQAGIESRRTETVGLGLLEIETIFQAEKIIARVDALHLSSGFTVSGYEIHAGRTVRINASAPLFRIIERDGIAADYLDGATSGDGRVIGSSIHGLFDRPGFRRQLINRVRQSKGLDPQALPQAADAAVDCTRAFDRLADVLEKHVDMHRIAKLAGVE
jgi:adenosylcobyric acid synthase